MTAAIDEFLEFLRGAAALGLWEFLTFLLAVAGAVAAHGNLATGDYELTFRHLDDRPRIGRAPAR